MIEKKRYMLFLVCCISALGGLLFGFDMAVISGILPFVQKQFNLTAVQEGWFVSSALVGCIAGVAMSGELGDRLGRKKMLVLSAILFLFAAIGCTLFATFFWIIVARILAGIGVGIASNIVPLYISEIAPSKIRGRLVTYYQLAVTFGILLAYLSNAAVLKFSLLAPIESSNQLLHFLFVEQIWRGMFSIGTVPALLFIVGLIFIPESPRWLIQKRRQAEGVKLLTELIGREEAEKDAANIKSNQDEGEGSYKDLLSPRMRRALLLGLLLPLFSQFSGINAIIYYGPSILNSAGISLSNSFQSQVIFGLANMLFTFIAVWKVDALGRRPLYLIGTAGASFSLFITGLFFYTGATNSMFLLVAVLAFLACFAFSIGPLKFVVASEIFPAKIRGRAMALSIMVMWIADTIVGQLTPIFLQELGVASTFWIFAIFCCVAFITVYLLLPETKGKSLEDIEHSWMNK
ncbi:sugar porter family MFS transporter [Arcticibacter eurypsychrophilus]|uniref:sugar porter family MFS transporter n=1 Tax=Arcticibacter eurypsychrophilus TaxID=1434752 RepID=UPI000A9B019B|nr:sugar porter family MFS transporter [Arcticibacter eurypsychrophilus]